jgi:nucleobase:cation symporter-1, NCS1 family
VYGRFAWRGLLAYAVGLGADFPFVSQPPYYTGPMVARLGGADLSWIIGFTVAAVPYAALAWPAQRAPPRRRPRRRRRLSPADGTGPRAPGPALALGHPDHHS